MDPGAKMSAAVIRRNRYIGDGERIRSLSNIITVMDQFKLSRHHVSGCMTTRKLKPGKIYICYCSSVMRMI